MLIEEEKVNELGFFLELKSYYLKINLIVILPSSALEYLTKLHIQFPMLFKLINKNKNRQTHCGVLEFVAEEGRCYLPYWVNRFYNQNF
jgi:hypothetical protein